MSIQYQLATAWKHDRDGNFVSQKTVTADDLIGLPITVWTPLLDNRKTNPTLEKFHGVVLDYATAHGAHKFLLYGYINVGTYVRSGKMTVHKQQDPAHKDRLRGLIVEYLAEGRQQQDQLKQRSFVKRQWVQSNKVIPETTDMSPEDILFMIQTGRLEELCDFYNFTGELMKLWPTEHEWNCQHHDGAVVLTYNPKVKVASVPSQILAGLVTDVCPTHEHMDFEVPLLVDEFVILPISSDICTYFEDLHRKWSSATDGVSNPTTLRMTGTRSILKTRAWSTLMAPTKSDLNQTSRTFRDLSEDTLLDLLGWKPTDLEKVLPADFFEVLPPGHGNQMLFQVNKKRVNIYRPFNNLDTKLPTGCSSQNNRTSPDTKNARQLTVEEVNSAWTQSMSDWDPKDKSKLNDFKSLCSLIRNMHLVPCKRTDDPSMVQLQWVPISQVENLLWYLLGVKSETFKFAQSTYTSQDARSQRVMLGNMWLANHAYPNIRAQLRALMKRHSVKKGEPKVLLVFHMFAGLGTIHLFKHLMLEFRMLDTWGLLLIHIEKDYKTRLSVAKYAELNEQRAHFKCGLGVFQFVDVLKPDWCADTSFISGEFEKHVVRNKPLTQLSQFVKHSRSSEVHERLFKTPFWGLDSSEFDQIEQAFGVELKFWINLSSVPCNNVSANNHRKEDVSVDGKLTGLRHVSLKWQTNLLKHYTARLNKK